MRPTYIFLTKMMLLFSVILMFPLKGNSQNGTVTGIVVCCYTNTPISGATVILGGQPYSANASGVFTIPGVAPGTYPIVALAAGFPSSSTTCTVVSNQTTYVNFCLSPWNATISGTVTSCLNGQPVIGVEVKIYGTVVGITDINGNYSMPASSGSSISITAHKYGYTDYTFSQIINSGNNIINFQMKPSACTPFLNTAQVNAAQTSVNISWSSPMQDGIMIYDDGIEEKYDKSPLAGTIRFVKFTPCFPGHTQRTSRIKVGPSCVYPFQYRLRLYFDDGPGGTPGNYCNEVYLNFNGPGWLLLGEVLPPYMIYGHSYYLGFVQMADSAYTGGIALDTTTNQNQSFIKTSNGVLTPVNGNYLIRGVKGTDECGDIPPSSFYYKVYRLVNGQQSNQSLWTYLGTTAPGVQSFTDNGWGALGCNPYLYAIRRFYPCCTDSVAEFTNMVGKCWTADLTFNLTGCCPAQGSGGIEIKMQNTTLADTVYTAITDPSGHAVIDHVWKGIYNITYTVPNCGSPYTITGVMIMGNQTIAASFGGGTANPPSNPAVEPLFLTAKWNKPISTYCLTGYNVYINGTLSGFSPDTVYQIPPAQVTMGVPTQLCVKAVYGFAWPPMSSQVCTMFTPQYLYPPVSFQADTSGCDVTLTWTKPVNGSGQTPAGLLGYYLYRDDAFIHFSPSPDSLSYTEYGLSGGTHRYNISSFYDLTSYGYAGQFRESEKMADTVIVNCTGDLPFEEGWNNGSYTYNGWTFDPAQGSWQMNNYDGDPAPCAAFQGTGKGMSSAYAYSLVSPSLNATQWECSKIHLKFDLKLEDASASSSEKINVEDYFDGIWHPVAEYANNGSSDWQTKDLILSGAEGKDFRIRFRANGIDQSAFHKWDIDNISVYGVCLAPVDLTAISSSHEIDLSWQAPCTHQLTYNIYRSDPQGNPPFEMINLLPVVDTFLVDSPYPWSTNNMYKYYVTAYQYGDPTCESPASDTVVAEFPVGTGADADQGVRVFPNPARDYVEIRSSEPIISAGIFTQEGSSVSEIFFNSLKGRMDTHQLATGVYFIKIRMENKMIVRKLVIL